MSGFLYATVYTTVKKRLAGVFSLFKKESNEEETNVSDISHINTNKRQPVFHTLDEAMKQPKKVGMIVSCCFLFGFMIWASLAPLSGAVVAGGQVTFTDNGKQIIQAIDGGQIEEIYVKNGNHVIQGQPLVRFEDVDASASVRIVRGSLFSMELTAIRLQHELSEKDSFDVPGTLLEQAEAYPELLEIVNNQRQMFSLRTSAHKAKADLLRQNQQTLGQELNGLNAQLEEEYKRLSFLDTELTGLRDLVKQGYATRNRLLETESRRSDIMRNINNYKTNIAKANEEIMAIDIKLLNLRYELSQEIERDLLNVRDKIIELNEKKRVVERNISRTMIVAPVEGVINNLKPACATGNIVRSGEPLMEIVPPDEELTIEAHLQRDHIDAILGNVKNIHEYGKDDVYVPAKVRLPAYSGRWRRPLKAVVTYVAADAEPITVNGMTRGGTYVIKVKILDEEMEKFPDIVLYPGMGAEVFVITGSRTMLSYLFEPVMGVLRHSMTN